MTLGDRAREMRNAPTEPEKLRDANLAQRGYQTIRFTNADVMTNIEGVLEVITFILASLPDRWAHRNPSPGLMSRAPQGRAPFP